MRRAGHDGHEPEAELVAHRLKIAGRADQLFTGDALALIHTTSRGYPRAVSNLCLLALVAAFATGRNLVDEAAARASVSEVVGDGELISSGRESAAGLADRPSGFAGFAPGRAWSRARVLEWWGGCRQEGIPTMILPKVRDPRFVTIRCGGTLTDADHHLLALWAAACAGHVLDLFEAAQPEDPRPRQAIEHARAWVRGEVTMMRARAAGGHAMGAARDLRGAPRYAAYAAGQAAVVAHVAAHELGAAAYGIKAARAAAPKDKGEAAGRLECRWQRDRLPEAIGELVLDDQRLRNGICWSVFDC